MALYVRRGFLISLIETGVWQTLSVGCIAMYWNEVILYIVIIILCTG